MHFKLWSEPGPAHLLLDLLLNMAPKKEHEQPPMGSGSGEKSVDLKYQSHVDYPNNFVCSDALLPCIRCGRMEDKGGTLHPVLKKGEFTVIRSDAVWDPIEETNRFGQWHAAWFADFQHKGLSVNMKQQQDSSPSSCDSPRVGKRRSIDVVDIFLCDDSESLGPPELAFLVSSASCIPQNSMSIIFHSRR